MKKFSTILGLTLALLLALSGNLFTVAAADVIQIPFLATNGGNDANTEMTRHRIERFNELYEGQYELVVEWIPGMAEDYRAKVKMLNASNDLPPVVGSLSAEPAFADLLIKHNRLIDLMPAFSASPEWQRVAIPESIEYNTHDGKLFGAPATSDSPTGIYYNKEHFADAGIETFPETWDDFFDACEKLKAAGHTPISLHLTETGWCTMLMGSASLAQTPEGLAFMNEQYPTQFESPFIIDMLNLIKRLYEYTTPDAKGGNYALAANNFSSGITSMIPNGPWMIPSLSDPQFCPEGFDELVSYAMFPGGILMSNRGAAYGDGVSVDVPEEVQLGAIEYLKFIASDEMIRYNGVMTGSFSNVVALTEEDMAAFSPPMREYADLVFKLDKTIPSYQSRWDPITQHEVIETEMINVVNGVITPEEMAAKMQASATQYKEDNE